ncbi:MAG TPA: hypothetical protein VJG85_00745, partial [Patescibacteria group bacterium]|nr:hypothetical protein [Patescibacteria group bacterium]
MEDTPTENPTPELPPTCKIDPNRNLNRLFIFGFLLLIILLFAGSLYFGLRIKDGYKPTVNRNNQLRPDNTITLQSLNSQKGGCEVEEEYKNTTSLNVTGTKQITNQMDIDKLNAYYKNQFLAQLAKVNGTVIEMDFNSDETIAAFIMEQEIEGEKKKRSVNIYDFNNNTVSKIYESEVVPGDTSGFYFLKIEDLGFSGNDQFLAITTSTGVLVYNFTTAKTTKLFDDPIEEGFFRVWSYFDPSFSPDNNLIILSTGYFEGRGLVLFDIKNNKLIDLEYNAYVSGTLFEGWYGDKILVQNYNTEEYLEDDKARDDYFLVNPVNTSDKVLFFDKPSKEFFYTLLDGDYLHFIFVQELGKPSGFYACNNIGEKQEVYAKEDVLYRYNVKSKELVEIMR